MEEQSLLGINTHPRPARKLVATIITLSILLGAALVAIVGLGVRVHNLQNEPSHNWDDTPPVSHHPSTEYDRSDDFPLKLPQQHDISAGHPRWFNRTFTEATWTNLDLSPDGQTIVLDILGDIYTLPITGGKATPIVTGVPFDVQPRYDPTGRYIAYSSDASGCDNIWVLDTTTNTRYPVTTELYHFVSNPWWISSTQLIAVKWYTSERSLGGGELWIYNVTIGAAALADGYHNAGVQIVGRAGIGYQVGPEEPIVGSADSNVVFYSKNIADRAEWTYSKDPHNTIYSIFRFDLTTKKTTRVAGGPGGAARPILSRFGKKLAYIKRTLFRTSLMIHDLENGNDVIVNQDLDFDQQECYAPAGVYPSYAFTQDDSAIVIWALGKIWSISTTTGLATEIPFNVDVALQLADTVRFKNNPSSLGNKGAKAFETRVAWSPTMDDTSAVAAFASVGSIYIKQTASKIVSSPIAPKPATFQGSPQISADGRFVAYVEWSDADLASVYARQLSDGRTWTIPTIGRGRYSQPRFSPTMNRIAYIRLSGDGQSGPVDGGNAGLYVSDITIDGTGLLFGAPRLVYGSCNSFTFSADGQTLFVTDGDYPELTLSAVATTGSPKDEPTTIATSVYATEIHLSPNEQWIAFIEFRDVYVAPFYRPAVSTDPIMNVTGLGADKFTVNPNAVRLTSGGGDFVSWSSDSKKIRWSLGSTLFEIPVESATNCRGQPLSCVSAQVTATSLGVQVNSSVPIEASIVFNNVTVATMIQGPGNEEVLTNQMIVVTGDKIAALGPIGSIAAPPGATVMDMAGAVVLPGFIDAHAHWNGAWAAEYKTVASWEFLVNLAFGVTTVHNPSSDTISTFYDAELVRSGKKIGPRIFSTGSIIYGAGGNIHCDIASVEDAKGFISQLQSYGAWSIKSYNQPCRSSRQKILQAARELGVNVVPEGGMSMYWNLNQIIDGHTTIEHALPIAPLYKDVIQLFASSGTAWTPTLIVNYGGIFGERYWYQHTNVWEDERLMRFAPDNVVQPVTVRRVQAEDIDYHHFKTAAMVKKVYEAGGIVQTGAHGEMQGIGFHWELRMFASSNMSNYDVLRAATINPARALGLDDQIGSVVVGKLADLLFYKAEDNPLSDIWNAAKIDLVLKDGHLYKAATLEQILPESVPAPTLPVINTPKL